MKNRKILLVAFCFVVFSVMGSAFLWLQVADAETDIPFSWVPSPAAENVSGYRLYQDAWGPDFIVQTITDPAANSCVYTLVNDSEKHVFFLTAYRTSDGAESRISQTQIWSPQKNQISIIGTFKLVQE